MARGAMEPIQIYGTLSISATTVTGRVALANGGENEHLEISNAGPSDVFVKLGDNTVTATAPSGATSGGYPVLAGQSKVIRRNRVSAGLETHLAAITSTGTATVYISVGDGQ